MPHSSPNPSPLSAQNAANLTRALDLCQQLRSPEPDAEKKLTQLRTLVNECRLGVRKQNPVDAQRRMDALDEARNYLHFLPNMEHVQAPGRLKSVSIRLKRALAN
jgi:hypothetical protein